ncbi:MAG: epimerase [Chloroflexi bacterium RBG_16_57_11]|nr:MAG: epimerase [Chloroflexi bacterium RBG_16_57_11]
MRILILGGTVFLGRALVDEALRRSHHLTLFNRGQSNPTLYPQVERLTGDRSVDLSSMKGRRWEAVIDTCGYLPRVVSASAATLADAVEHYTFISTESVYASPLQPGLDENAPLGVLPDESVEEITGETYGPLKVLCERAVEAVLPGRTLVVRPGLIVGPHDTSDRFTYWPYRVALGGRVLAPGRPEREVQFIDVRDLALWIIQMVERRQTGLYNADGQPEAVSMKVLLEACKTTSGSDAQFAWVSDEFLEKNNVGAWMEMPLWIPETDPDAAGFFTIRVEKAQAAGLSYRPLIETVADTLSWARTRPQDYNWRAGLTREREAELLDLISRE